MAKKKGKKKLHWCGSCAHARGLKKARKRNCDVYARCEAFSTHERNVVSGQMERYPGDCWSLNRDGKCKRWEQR